MAFEFDTVLQNKIHTFTVLIKNRLYVNSLEIHDCDLSYKNPQSLVQRKHKEQKELVSWHHGSK